jgi:hypothetical protein
MSAIGPGDFVECVRASPPKTVQGALYRVSEVGDDPGALCAAHGLACESGGWVRLQGVSHGRFVGFCVHCFRPVYRPKAGLIAQLLAPNERAWENA